MGARQTVPTAEAGQLARPDRRRAPQVKPREVRLSRSTARATMSRRAAGEPVGDDGLPARADAERTWAVTALSAGSATWSLDGRSVNSCAVLTARLRGKQIQTVAGLRTRRRTSPACIPLQRAFWEEGAFQCGICTKGFLMTSYALLEREPRSQRRGDPARARRDPVPLRRTGADRHGGQAAPRPRCARAPASAETRSADRGRPLMPHRSEVLGTRVPAHPGASAA